MRSLALILSCLMLCASLGGCLGAQEQEETTSEPTDTTPLRVNHIQVKGTHNSYHLKPIGPTIRAYDYSHEPLDTQAQQFGVRQFEIDVWWSPGQQLQVYHNQYDSRTTCQTLQQCLQVLLEWSDSTLNHGPLSFWIES